MKKRALSAGINDMITCLGHWFCPIVLPAVCLWSSAEKATLNQSYCADAGEERNETNTDIKKAPTGKKGHSLAWKGTDFLLVDKTSLILLHCVCVCMCVCVCVCVFVCFHVAALHLMELFSYLAPFSGRWIQFYNHSEADLFFLGQSTKCVMLTKGEWKCPLVSVSLSISSCLCFTHSHSLFIN